VHLHVACGNIALFFCEAIRKTAIQNVSTACYRSVLQNSETLVRTAFIMTNKRITKKPPSSRDHPWQIRGVPLEVRTAASVAARKQGQTVGQWVADAVMQKATQGITLPSSPTDNQAFEQLADEMRQRFEQLEAGQGDKPAPAISKRKVLRLFGLPVASFGDE